MVYVTSDWHGYTIDKVKQLFDKAKFSEDDFCTDNANSAENILSSLGDKVAMSISIGSFAGGLSGKLENGDIVSICVTDKAGNTTVPAELKYVRVITTTTSGGVDENEVVPNEDGTFDLPDTITVLVSVKQATIPQKQSTKFGAMSES